MSPNKLGKIIVRLERGGKERREVQQNNHKRHLNQGGEKDIDLIWLGTLCHLHLGKAASKQHRRREKGRKKKA